MKRRFVRTLAAAAVASVAMLVAAGRLFTAEPSGSDKRPPSQSATELAVAEKSGSGKSAIEASLAEPATLEFTDTSLKDVADELRQKHHVEIKFDWYALKQAGIDPSALAITGKYDGISLRSALNLILRQYDLALIVADDVLLVTSREKAEATLHAHVYDVRDLLSIDEDGRADYESLVGLITSVAGPPYWDDMGGPGTISPVEPGCLIISQSDELHRHIASLLTAMRQVREQIKAGKIEAAIEVGSNAASKAIEKRLREKVDLEFSETPLDDVLTALRKQEHLEIQVNPKAFRAAGLDSSTLTITESVHGLPLRSALNQLLRQLNLTWQIADETLLVTTKDAAESALEIRLYPISDFVNDAEETGSSAAQVINAIQSTVAQATWAQSGGPGEIQPYGDNKNLMLAVLQTREIHEQISDLLPQLRGVFRKQQEAISHQPAKAKEPEEMAVRVYDLRVSSAGSPAMSPQETAEIVKALVEPKSWQRSDSYIRGATGKLIVRQLPSIHREIEKLLVHLDVLPLKEPASGRTKSLLGRGLGASGGGF